MSTSKPNILELAKQGNTKAITALINKPLSNHGIFVFDIELTDSHLTIRLQSKTHRISEAAINKIKLGAQKLCIESVKSVEVVDVSNKFSLAENSSSAYTAQRDTNQLHEKPMRTTSKKPTHTSINLAKNKNKESNLNLLKFINRKNLLIAGSGSGVGLVSLVAFLVLGFGGGDSCKVDGQPAYKLFQSFEGEWSDAVELAHNTSRMSLAQPISDMQSIKREVEGTEWEKCSQPAANFFVKAMDKKIDGFIRFLDSDNPESSIQDDFKRSEVLMYDYYQEYLLLLPRKERIAEEKEQEEIVAQGALGIIESQQLLKYLEGEPFIQKIEGFNEGSVVIASEDSKYHLEIVDATASKFVATASAKERGLRSYSIGILAGDFSDGEKFGTILCESDESSQTVTLPVLSDGSWVCSSDSTAIE